MYRIYIHIYIFIFIFMFLIVLKENVPHVQGVNITVLD